MAIFKRGQVYWYHFWFRGKHIQRSTRQGNARVARQLEAAHRVALAKGELGIHARPPVPTLAEFIEHRVEPWARSSFEKTSPKTWKGWYRTNLRILRAYSPLAKRRLDEITSEHVAGFAAHRQSQGKKVSTVNATLRVLRRIFRLAIEWGVISSAPKIKLLRGEHHRDRVVAPREEELYLSAAPEPLKSIATVLIDTGLRPEECFRMRWESVQWDSLPHQPYGSFWVTHGKTPAARREIPMSARVRSILEARWNEGGRPARGWVWPAPTFSGHVEPSTLKKQHAKTFAAIAARAKQTGEEPVEPFVLYTLRHTFLTRLAASGVDAWTLARIAGHASIAMSARYVHPGQRQVADALARLGQQAHDGRRWSSAGDERQELATISATV